MISDQWAVLMRELPARIVDISGSGCLIESRTQLQVGTFGTLQLRIGTEDCEDDIEVVRCDAVEGAGAVYHVGVRFLWTTPRRSGSIRHVVSRYITALESADTTRVM